MRPSRIVLLVLIAVFLAQIGFYYTSLPETVASHFDGAGNPDRWMSKSSFVVLEIVLLLLIIGEFTVLPLLIEKMPDALINLPNKDYWLAVSRRAETFAILRIYFEWFSTGLLVLFILVNQLVFRANLGGENLPGTPMWLIIGVFVLFSVVWLMSLMRKFRKPVKNL